MSRSIAAAVLLVSAFVAAPAIAQPQGMARPDEVLKEVVAGMPRGEKQEIRVMTATLKPGDQTPFHTHRFPVTALVLEGAFTLELEGRPPVTIKAGEAIVEPPNVRMTGYNRTAAETTRIVIFYVADPGTPFLDMVH